MAAIVDTVFVLLMVDETVDGVSDDEADTVDGNSLDARVVVICVVDDGAVVVDVVVASINCVWLLLLLLLILPSSSSSSISFTSKSNMCTGRCCGNFSTFFGMIFFADDFRCHFGLTPCC